MKLLLKILIPVVILLALLRFFFPPLMELGYADAGDDVQLQIMVNPNGGVDPFRIYVENQDGIDTDRIADETCSSLAADLAAGSVPLEGLNEAGNIEVIFVGGGRYFFRFAKADSFAFAYDADGCSLMKAENDG